METITILNDELLLIMDVTKYYWVLVVGLIICFLSSCLHTRVRMVSVILFLPTGMIFNGTVGNKERMMMMV